ncbi:hypothetical protein D3C72_2511970 [compost metagenome]
MPIYHCLRIRCRRRLRFEQLREALISWIGMRRIIKYLHKLASFFRIKQLNVLQANLRIRSDLRK